MTLRGREAARLRHSKACTRKRRYGTASEAQTAAAGLRGRGERVNAYACAVCKGWHVGGTPTWRRSDTA